MRILIVNDDGINSPGIHELSEVAAQMAEVWVVAPDHQCSGMSQKLTLFEEMPVRKANFPVKVAGAWSVGGTPADCVKLAFDCLLDKKPDYVFSGINDGCNAGYDIVYSGTIGACMESVMNGVPAIAFSAMSHSSFDNYRDYLLPVARELINLGQAGGEIWNVNFPLEKPKGIKYDRKIAPMQMYEAEYSLKIIGTDSIYTQRGVPISTGIAPSGSDIEAIQSGYISIGRIISPVI